MVKIFLLVGSGIGPLTTAPVDLTVLTIFSADLSELTQFADMFQADATVMWGISCDNNLRDDTVTARLIASNLKLSPVKYQHYGNKDIGK